jgi:hypothetical protein
LVDSPIAINPRGEAAAAAAKLACYTVRAAAEAAAVGNHHSYYVTMQLPELAVYSVRTDDGIVRNRRSISQGVADRGHDLRFGHPKLRLGTQH